MGSFWYTADWHLGHERIIDLCDRPFASVAAMNEALVERYNAVVGDEDVCWFVGDVCMGPIDESLALVGRLRGRKYLVAGNHDRCFEGYGDNRVNRTQLRDWVARYRRAGFDLIVTGAHTRRNGFGSLVELRPASDDRRARRLVGELCHFPTTGESTPDRPDRFAEYRPRPLGGVDRRPQTRRWVICGHVHDRWLTSGRNVNVGVDVWNFAPVREDELAALVDAREREYGASLDDPATSTTLRKS